MAAYVLPVATPTPFDKAILDIHEEATVPAAGPMLVKPMAEKTPTALPTAPAPSVAPAAAATVAGVSTILAVLDKRATTLFGIHDETLEKTPSVALEGFLRSSDMAYSIFVLFVLLYCMKHETG
jgi:hypothetical protein